MLVMAAGSLAGCGNKGDLYLVPDQITDQEIQELDRVLRVEDTPAAEPAEVDDMMVFDDPLLEDPQLDDQERPVRDGSRLLPADE